MAISSHTDGSPHPPLRALLVWPGGDPPAELQALFDAAGISLDLAATADAAVPIARAKNHDVVFAPPPEDEQMWLAPVRAEFPSLETVALVSARDPRAPLARRAGADQLADLTTLSAEELADVTVRGAANSRLRRENRRLSEENVELASTNALYQRCHDLLATVEIEVLQELIVRTFSEIVEARSAALWVRTPRGALQLRAHLGPFSRAALPAQIDPQDGPLASRIESREPFTTEGVRGSPGFYVPLCSANGHALGLLLLEDKVRGPFSSEDLARARTVATFAASALHNARRFHELERVGLRDRESATYNLSYFIDYASKELYKSSRYGRQFSLCTITIDNLEQVRTRLSPGGYADALRGLISKISSLARDSDVLARVAENELYLVLPETDRFGVMMLERRIREILVGEDLARGDGNPESGVSLAVGNATYPLDGLDFDELLFRCRQRSEEARQTLCRRLHLGELDFWQSLTALLGPWPARIETQPPPASRPGVPFISASYRGPLPEDQFERVQKEIGRELAREPRARGVLYVAAGDAEPSFPFVELLPPEITVRACVLVRRGQKRVDHPSVSTVFLQGASPLAAGALQLEFLFYLSEVSAYAYARRKREPIAFHTSDRPLVDHLIARLQHTYDLQPY